MREWIDRQRIEQEEPLPKVLATRSGPELPLSIQAVQEARPVQIVLVPADNIAPAKPRLRVVSNHRAKAIDSLF
jgi:hypothetical protein